MAAPFKGGGMKRPETVIGGMATTQPNADTISLLGGHCYKGVHATRAEHERVMRLYGFQHDDNVLMNAGAEVRAWREAQTDGLRLMAFLAEYLERGEDPVVYVARMLADAGYEVGVDLDDGGEENETSEKHPDRSATQRENGQT